MGGKQKAKSLILWLDTLLTCIHHSSLSDVRAVVSITSAHLMTVDFRSFLLLPSTRSAASIDGTRPSTCLGGKSTAMKLVVVLLLSAAASLLTLGWESVVRSLACTLWQ